jgi:hypothetical protein
MSTRSIHAALHPLVRAAALAATVLAALAAPPAVSAQDTIPTIEDRTEGMDRMDGFFDLYWDDATGTAPPEFDPADGEPEPDFEFDQSLPEDWGV